MTKTDYSRGSSTIDDFFATAAERHDIYLRRRDNLPPPWTEDPIFATWKFTNVFRELDRGTLALRRMTADRDPLDPLFFWNVFWYRVFNREEHSYEFGWNFDLEALLSHMRVKKQTGAPIFTGAHMTYSGVGDKLEWFASECLYPTWEKRATIAGTLRKRGTIEGAFERLKKIPGVGPFVAYEIACDLRFSLLREAPDVLTWANVGPGSKRGLERLGLAPKVWSMTQLLDLAPRSAFARHLGGDNPLFELREIEHWLCEFDKYERVRTGVGKPRARFHPRAEGLLDQAASA